MQIRCLYARFVALGYFCRKVDKLETDVFVIVIFLRKYINYHSVNISIEKLWMAFVKNWISLIYG